MKSIDCPKCGGVMAETSGDGASREVCAGCGGVWIDHLALKVWLERKLGATQRDPTEEFLRLWDSSGTGLRCPLCGTELRASTVEELTVEWCEACRGLFLDRDELQRITSWKDRKQAEQRRATLKASVAAVFELLDDALPSRQLSRPARPEREHGRTRKLVHLAAGERPTADEGSAQRRTIPLRPGARMPFPIGGILVGGFLSRLVLIQLGLLESPRIPPWAFLVAGAALLALGLWLTGPHGPSLAHVSRFVVLGCGVFLIVDQLDSTVGPELSARRWFVVLAGGLVTVVAWAFMRQRD